MIPGTRRVPGFVDDFLLLFCKKRKLLCDRDSMFPDSYSLLPPMLCNLCSLTVLSLRIYLVPRSKYVLFDLSSSFPRLYICLNHICRHQEK